LRKKGGHAALTHAFNVLSEGDRKGGYIGSFNTLGKIGKHKRSSSDSDAPKKRRRRTRKYDDDYD
jgi:hypothetical protein